MPWRNAILGGFIEFSYDQWVEHRTYFEGLPLGYGRSLFVLVIFTAFLNQCQEPVHHFLPEGDFVFNHVVIEGAGMSSSKQSR